MNSTDPAVDDERDLSIPAGADDERDERLADGADHLTSARSSILAHPRFLVIAAATLMSIGVTAIILGWAGASRATFLEEQVPYMISGGLLGVALAVIGALMLFSHWLTVAIREARAHEASRRADHEELVGVLADLANAMNGQATNGKGGNGNHAGGERTQRPLRATERRS